MSLDTPLEEREDLSVRTMTALQDLGVATLGELVVALADAAPMRMHPEVVAELRALFAEAGAPFPAQITATESKPRRAALPKIVASGGLRERWAVIEAWLRENHPALHESFGPPAQRESIAELERALGRELPPDLAEFLLLHDGQAKERTFVRAGVGFTLLSTSRISGAYRILSGLPDGPSGDPSSIDAGVRNESFAGGWIPIGASARGRDFLCLDVAPAPGGAAGQIIEVVVDDEPRRVIAASFVELLSMFFTQAQAGELDED